MMVVLQVAQRGRRQFASYLIREFPGKVLLELHPPVQLHFVHLFLGRGVRRSEFIPVSWGVKLRGWDDMVVNLRGRNSDCIQCE